MIVLNLLTASAHTETCLASHGDLGPLWIVGYVKDTTVAVYQRLFLDRLRGDTCVFLVNDGQRLHELADMKYSYLIDNPLRPTHAERHALSVLQFYPQPLFLVLSSMERLVLTYNPPFEGRSRCAVCSRATGPNSAVVFINHTWQLPFGIGILLSYPFRSVGFRIVLPRRIPSRDTRAGAHTYSASVLPFNLNLSTDLHSLRQGQICLFTAMSYNTIPAPAKRSAEGLLGLQKRMAEASNAGKPVVGSCTSISTPRCSYRPVL